MRMKEEQGWGGGVRPVPDRESLKCLVAPTGHSSMQQIDDLERRYMEIWGHRR